MQPKTDSTTSKLESSKGSASASPSTQRTSGAATDAIASRPGVMSRPVTEAPARAAGIAALPVPQATSSTSSPGPTRASRTDASAALLISSATAV